MNLTILKILKKIYSADRDFINANQNPETITKKMLRISGRYHTIGNYLNKIYRADKYFIDTHQNPEEVTTEMLKISNRYWLLSAVF